MVDPNDAAFSASLRFRSFPSDAEFVPLPIEGLVLRELLIDGNGKDGEWLAVSVDGRRFTIPVNACPWKIAVEGAVLTEVLGLGALSLCVR